MKSAMRESFRIEVGNVSGKWRGRWLLFQMKLVFVFTLWIEMNVELELAT